MSTWTFMNIKGQGHSLTFVQGHSDWTFSNFFCSETARPIEAKFLMELPWDVRNENLFKCSRSDDHTHTRIWWKTSKIFFGTKRLMTLELGTCIQHRVLEYDPRLTLTIFMTGSNLFPNASAWLKAYTALRGLYFQVCSNSAYPQHSGKAKKKICVFQVSRPYLGFWPDPKHFIVLKKKKNYI